ncbi:MAG TPA: ornithine cyclodeaminase family protein [Xanthobacteraceae bacterium]|nr:ornithine cyclodeaminase family protein [Xanthobacteraceae bacterium]
MPIYINENDVTEFLDMPSAVAALRDAFSARAREEANIVPRTRWAFEDRRLNVMGGGIATQHRYALKAYGSSAFHVLLYSMRGLLAIIEANVLGQIRTGAATGVATELMARPEGKRVALLGTGRQARAQALALSAVGMLSQLFVFARTRDKLEAFCAKLVHELAAPVSVSALLSAEAAVANADIVVAATNSATPVVMNSWVRPGTHVVGMGANAANRREIDAEIILRASLVVTDDIPQAKLEAGEFIDLAKAGRLDWSTVKPLHEIIAGPHLARDPAAITVFKSLGVGLEDVAVASVVYDRAIASGRFKPL